MAVDEPGNRRQPAAVELLDLAEEREVGHRADRGDVPVLAEHEGVRGDLDVAQRGATERRVLSSRRRDLREVADQQGGHAAGIDGRSTACSRAAASASS